MSLRSSREGVLPLLAWIAILAGLGLVAMALVAIFRSLVIILVVLAVIIIMYFAYKGNWFQSKGGIVAVLIIILVLPVFAVLLIGPASVFGVDTNSWYNYDGAKVYETPIAYMRFVTSGKFDDGVNGADEMFDSPAYSTDIFQSGEGSKIVAAPKVCLDIYNMVGWTTPEIKKAVYHIRFGTSPISMDTAEATIKDVGSVDVVTCDKGWSWVEPLVMYAGNDVGYLKIDLHFQGQHDNWIHAATDRAEVRPGWGEIKNPPRGAAVEVGKAMNMEFVLGWACAASSAQEGNTESEGGGWSYNIVSAGQQKTVQTEKLGCGGSMAPSHVWKSYTPVQADFRVEGSECHTELTIELWSHLYPAAEKIVYTYDLSSGLRPPKPTLEVSSVNVEMGNPITATASCPSGTCKWQVAPKTGKVFLYENDTNEITFTPNVAGDWEITVNCFENCLPSDPVTQTVHVYPKGEQPPLPYTDWLPLIITIIVLAVIETVLALLPIRPGWLKYLLMLIAALVILALAWWLGVF